MKDSFVDILQSPGEHALMLAGGAGRLEAVMTIPKAIASNHILFLGHPHSLQGGTMNNKVVTTLARAARDLGIPSLRFNFRGVGQSQGAYDNGIGESDDLLSLVHSFQKTVPEYHVLYAGFSFGSYVVYRAAAQSEHTLLLTVAPPVERYDYQAFSPAPPNWEIIMGDADEVVAFSQVSAFAQTHTPPIPMHVFNDTSHFFHGQLVSLRQCATDIFTNHLRL